MLISLPPPVDMVSVSYVRDDTYRLTVTNETGHAEDDPGIDLYRGRAFAFADHNAIVPAHGKWSVTIKFPADGKWSLGTVDSLVPGNPDSAYSEYALRWNHLASLYVR